MTNAITQLSVQQLKRAIAIRVQIEGLEQELSRVLQSAPPSAKPVARAPKRKMSEEAKAKIAAGQKARWAERKKKSAGLAIAPTLSKPGMSSAVKAKIAADQTARWAKRKKAAAPTITAPQKKGRISDEGRARIIAGTKARWAKYNAAKKKGGALEKAPTPSKPGQSVKK